MTWSEWLVRRLVSAVLTWRILVNESAILAARRAKKLIGSSEFAEAIDRIIAGPARRSRVISDREKEITAYHEAGHALVAHVLPNADKPFKVTIVARGQSGGHTRYLPEEDRNLWTREQFKDMLAAAMGGRVAEELVFDEITTRRRKRHRTGHQHSAPDGNQVWDE